MGLVVGAVALVMLFAITLALVRVCRESRSSSGTYSPQAIETAEISKLPPLPTVSSPERLI